MPLLTDEQVGIPKLATDDEVGIPRLMTDEEVGIPTSPSSARSTTPATGEIRASSLKDRLRMSAAARRLFGPTDAEREAMIGSTGSPKELLDTAFKFATPPPPVQEVIRKATDPGIKLLPDSVAGVATGLREMGLNVPWAAGAVGLGTKAGNALLGIFTGDFALSVPEQKQAFDAALKRGDKKTAYQIATQAVTTGALLGLGAKHALSETPTEIPELPGGKAYSAAQGTMVQADPTLALRLSPNVAPPPLPPPPVTPAQVAPLAPQTAQALAVTLESKPKEIPLPPPAEAVKEVVTEPEVAKATEPSIPTPPAPQANLVGVPVSEVPANQIALRPDLMQFKRMDNTAKGTTEADRITGEWSDLKAGNILLWEPKDPTAYGLEPGQKYIVANGHHRVEFGETQGVQGYNAQIVREADGYRAEDARRLGAEINIADGKGTIYDQAKFIRNTATTLGKNEAVAEARRIGTKGQRASDIAINASDSLFDSFINEQITPEQTEAIAKASPGNEPRQQVGIRMARGGMAPDVLTNFLKAMEVGGEVKADQLDMFGHDETAIRQAEDMAKRATEIQKGIRKQITAVQGAARNPAEAAKLGVNVTDPQGVLNRISELKTELDRWSSWPMHPDLVAQARGEPAPSKPATPRQADMGDLLAPKGPGIVGMGGATPEEMTPSGQTVTGIKNASIDAQRAERGLDPIMKPLRETFQGWWDKAMAMIDADPSVQDNLISSLQSKMRMTDPTETALLAHREADLRNEYAQSTRDIAQAFDDAKALDAAGKTEAAFNRRQDLVAAQARRAMWSDKMSELEKVSEASGTKLGQGLVARKIMTKDDFTLAAIETSFRAAKGGEPLDGGAPTGPERAEAERLAAEYKAKSDNLESLLAQRDERIAKLESEKAFAELQASTKPKYSSFVLQTAEKWVKRWEEEAKQARQNLAGKFLSPTPKDLLDLAKIVRFRIAEIGLEALKITDYLVTEFGEGVRPYVQGAIDTAKKMIESEGEHLPKAVRESVKQKITKAEPINEREAIVDKIAAKVEKGDQFNITPNVQKLARMFVEQGTKDRETLIDQVHEVLKEVLPDITRRETMDAISGYGDFKQLTKDQVSVTLRDLKGQMQQVGKLQDMAAKLAPQKTGVERRTPSDEERRLIKEVNEMKKKGGYTVTDPATQLRSALQSRKTYYTNRITDLRAEIVSKERAIRNKTAPPTDPALEKIKAEYEKVKSEHDQIFGKAEMTPEQRVKLAINAVQKSIEDLDRRIKTGDIGPKSRVSKTPNTPELAAAKARRDALREQLQEMRDLAQPKKTPEQIALQGFKTRTANRIAELTQKIADGDFSTKPRRTLTLDTEAQRAQADLKRVVNQYEDAKRRYELENRKPWQKTLDKFVRWERAFKLSSPVVFGKLTAAAMTRVVTTGTEELAGAILGRLPGISDIAARAPREGGINVQAMAKAMTEAFTKGMADAAQTAKTGLSNLDVLYGEKRMIDQDWVNIFGQLHGMLKAPVKRAEFTLSLEKRVAHAIATGVDVSDPMVQTRLHVEALNDGYRSIFMQRGLTSDMFNNLVNMMASSKKHQPAGEVAARVARFIFPIVRVPVNIVGETFTGVIGLPRGAVELAVRTWGKGIESLKPEEADLVMRNLKKGAIGAALMTIGFLNPESIGGYDWREKRKPDTAKTGGFRVFGVDIPRWATHAPWFELMQFGATIRHVKDQHVKGQEKGISEGMWAAALGLSEETPFIGEMVRAAKATMSPDNRSAFLGELAKSTVSPAILQQIARWTDPEEMRKPRTFTEHVEMGIPFLRENVPLKNAPKNP